MIVSVIVAMARNRVIGRENRLPWRLPADLKHFKETTMGHPVIMGRRTHESIGRSLPGRVNIVLTRDPDYRTEGCIVVSSFEQALNEADGHDEVFVIGGQSVYTSALPLADRIYVTLIDQDFDGDAYFPAIDSREWHETSRQAFEADATNPLRFSFVTYERKPVL